MKTTPFFVITLTLPCAAQTTISATDRYAYAANAGWIDFRPSAADGVRVTETYLTGKAYAANFGWIDFGDGSPDNGHAYTNTSATDFGVNLSSAGQLIGSAWSANTGWITFEPAQGRPRLSFLTGKLSGLAWSPNMGWIALDTPSSDLATTTLVCPDTDGDGLADAWEMLHFGRLTTATVTSNTDGDRFTDASEFAAGTDPRDPASWLRIVSQEYDSGLKSGKLEFTSETNRLYRIEHAADPAGAWTLSTSGTFAPDNDKTTTAKLSFPAGARRFFRVVAVKPLQP